MNHCRAACWEATPGRFFGFLHGAAVFLLVFFTLSASAQTWNGGGANDNWGTGANWAGGVAPVPSTTTDISFGGSTRLTPNNNYTAFDDFRNILFNAGAGNFAVSGNSIDLFGKVENNSTALQTLGLTLAVNTTFIEINPVSGDLAIGSSNSSSVFLNANQMRVYGNNGKTLSIGANTVISGASGTVAINENSTLLYQSAHTYTGDTFINAGSLQINSGGSANSSILRLGDTSGTAGARLALNTSALLNSTLVIRAGSTGTKTIAGINASGNATNSGNIFLDAGLVLTNASGGSLFLTGGGFDVKAQTLALTNQGNVTITGTISNSTGSGKIIKGGSGILTLGGSNNFGGGLAGAVTINGGTVSIAADSGLGLAPAAATAGQIVLNSGVLQHTSTAVGGVFISGNRGISLGVSGGTIDIPSSAAILIYTSGQITGANTLTKTGAGTFRNTTPTSITFTKLVVSGGLYQAAADTIFGAVPGSLSSDAITLNGGGISANGGFTLNVNRGITLGASGGTINCASDLTYLGPIVGSGNLVKNGSSQLILQQAASVNTYSGDTIITAGNLSVNATATLGNGAGGLVLGGGNLVSANSRTTAPLANNVLLTNSSSIRSSTSLTSGTRVLPLSGTITGTAGTLTLTNLGSAGTVFQARFTGGGFDFTRPMTIDNGTGSTEMGLYNDNTVADQTWSGVISGTGSIQRNVPSSIAGGNSILSNGGNSYSGGTQLRAGFIGLGADNCMGTGSVTLGWDPNPVGLFASGGARSLTNNLVVDLATGGGGATNLQIRGANNVTLSGRIQIHTNLTYFTISNSAFTHFSGVITNTGTTSLGISKLGPGTLAVSGANTYSGTTTVGAGTLLVNNTSGSGTSAGAVSVLSGATLGGTGTISGTLTINSGGTLSPGTSIGNLKLSSTPSLSGTNLMEINSATSPNADKLTVNGNPLAFGGVLTVQNIGGSLSGGEEFDLFDATSISGSFSTTNMPSLAGNLNWWFGQLTSQGKIVVNRAPNAGNLTVARGRDASVKIPISTVMGAVSDPDSGDTANFAGVDSGVQGASVTTNATYIYYSPANNNNDSLTYSVTDTRGGLRTATIAINVTNSVGVVTISNLGGTNMTLSFYGIPGFDYVVQRSPDLAAWTDIFTNTAPAGGLIQYTETPPFSPAFYRTRNQ